MLELTDNIKTIMITISHMFKELSENKEDTKRKPSLMSREENYNSKDF